MTNLQITDAKAKKINEAGDLALDICINALKGKVAPDAEEVKLSMKMLSVEAKNRQSSTHQVAIEFGMAQSIASDPKQLKEYIGITNPQVRKALEGKVK